MTVRDSVSPLLGVPTGAPKATGSCPDVLTLLSQHIEDEISSDVCLEMERHIERCARCRGACDSLKRTLALCRTAASDTPVPAPVQTKVRRAVQEFLRIS